MEDFSGFAINKSSADDNDGKTGSRCFLVNILEQTFESIILI